MNVPKLENPNMNCTCWKIQVLSLSSFLLYCASCILELTPVTEWLRCRPHRNHGMSIFILLTLYEVRQMLLQNLSAYHVAKLDMVLHRFLEPRERRKYLSPARDLL